MGCLGLFSPARSSVHWPESCKGSWAIGVQVNVWRTFPAGGKHSAPDDVTCNIPGCGPELGGRRYRADCFNICRQREPSEQLDRCIVRSSNRNTPACRGSVCPAAADDGPSLIKTCQASPAARLHNRGSNEPLPRSIACPAATVGGQVLTGDSRSGRKQKNCVPGSVPDRDGTHPALRAPSPPASTACSFSATRKASSSACSPLRRGSQCVW